MKQEAEIKEELEALSDSISDALDPDPRPDSDPDPDPTLTLTPGRC